MKTKHTKQTTTNTERKTQPTLSVSRPKEARQQIQRPPCYIKLITPTRQNIFFENGRTYWQDDEFAFDITDAQFWWIKNGKAIHATVGEAVLNNPCPKGEHKAPCQKLQPAKPRALQGLSKGPKRAS